MQRIIRSIFVLFLLECFTVASAQLPPKVIADKYLVQTEQLLEKQDYEAALNMVEKIIALQKEHNLTLSDNLYFKDAVAKLLEKKDYITALNIMDRFIALQKEHSLILPDEFHFQYAQATFFKYELLPVPADSIKVALELVSKYLSAETEGEFYREALALLLKIEEKLEEFKELEFSPDRTCAGKPVDSSCWMALANHPECYFWNSYLQKDETMTWSGACSDGLAEGEGTLITTGYSSYNTKYTTEEIGHFQNGRKYGQWVVRLSEGRVMKETYMNGILHGSYFFEWPKEGVMEEGSYANGKKHGQWVERRSNGSVTEINYMNGILHGPYVFEFPKEGVMEEGSYVNGKKHGQWVLNMKNGRMYKGSYVNGKKHGRWIYRYYRDEPVQEVTYVNGEEQ